MPEGETSKVTQADDPVVTAVTAKGRYDHLSADRQPYLNRAYDCAELTIPTLFPRPGQSAATDYNQPFQSVGSDGVNNLAAKFLLALFPPGEPFFRLTIDDFVLEALKQKATTAGDNPEDARAEFEEALAKIERAVTLKMEQQGIRQPLFECFEHLEVAGNGLLHILPSGALKFFRLDRYVVKRDSDGNVIEIIVMETLDRLALPPLARAIVEAEDKGSPYRESKSVGLYTRTLRTETGWRTYQEICGQEVPGSGATYPLEKSPWLPLRFIAVSGEDYGRGFVEERLGDLRSLETLTQAMVEGTAIAAKVLIGVNEGGVTSKKVIAEAANGEVVDGNMEKDVTVLRIDKAQDFNVALQLRNDLKKSLERSFLLLAGVQRDAERVTAEEIRVVVNELQAGLGGPYSIFGQELQRPLIVRYMAQMTKARQLPSLPDKTVTPSIITGLDGLGRNSDLQKLDVLMKGVLETFGPQAVGASMNLGAYIERRGTALGMDVKGLAKSDAQMASEAQAAAQAANVQKLGPAAIKAASDHSLAAQKSSQDAEQASAQQ